MYHPRKANIVIDVLHPKKIQMLILKIRELELIENFGRLNWGFLYPQITLIAIWCYN